MVTKSIFCLPSALVSLFSILGIWKWFHEIGLVFLIKKHPLHFKFSHSNPEKFAYELGNWKWENDDFGDLGPKIPTLSIVSMAMKTWNAQYETSKGHFIKWTLSGELPIGLKSHQDSLFWSNRPLFSEGYCERPCI